MKPARIAWGVYTDRNGTAHDFEILWDGDRKHGLREWARKALANGGEATKADGALRMRVKPCK